MRRELARALRAHPNTSADSGGSLELSVQTLPAHPDISLRAVRSRASRHTLPTFRDPDPVIVPHRWPICQRIRPKVTVEPNRVQEAPIPNRSL